eukprot:m.627550 g.627550  ORF g.627550 m.627550 type:complete len:578 (-) comp22560_c0_seq4:1440-3173(-)
MVRKGFAPKVKPRRTAGSRPPGNQKTTVPKARTQVVNTKGLSSDAINLQATKSKDTGSAPVEATAAEAASHLSHNHVSSSGDEQVTPSVPKAAHVMQDTTPTRTATESDDAIPKKHASTANTVSEVPQGTGDILPPPVQNDIAQSSASTSNRGFLHHSNSKESEHTTDQEDSCVSAPAIAQEKGTDNVQSESASASAASTARHRRVTPKPKAAARRRGVGQQRPAPKTPAPTRPAAMPTAALPSTLMVPQATPTPQSVGPGSRAGSNTVDEHAPVVVRCAQPMPVGPMLPDGTLPPISNPTAPPISNPVSSAAGASAAQSASVTLEPPSGASSAQSSSVALVPVTLDDVAALGKRRARKRPKKPDTPEQMTMKHLIYHNPKSKKPRGAKAKAAAVTRMGSGASAAAPGVPGNPDPAPLPTGTQPDARPAPPTTPSGPRVMIDAATGQLVVDESSLEQQAQYVNQETVGQLVQEERHASYSSYTKRSASRSWTAAETEIFYRGIRAFGLNFDMISLVLLPQRDHTMLKKKYLREDKANSSKIDDALHPNNRLYLDANGNEMPRGTATPAVSAAASAPA